MTLLLSTAISPTSDQARRASAAGTGAILWSPPRPAGADETAVFVAICAAEGIDAFLRVDVAALPDPDAGDPRLFAVRYDASADAIVDPRAPVAPVATARLSGEGAAAFVPAIVDRLAAVAGAGVKGLVLSTGFATPALVAEIVAALRVRAPGVLLLGDAGEGWDGRVGAPDAQAAGPTIVEAQAADALRAAAEAEGVVLPLAVLEQDDGPALVAQVAGLLRDLAPYRGARRATGDGAVMQVLRARDGDLRITDEVALVVIADAAADVLPAIPGGFEVVGDPRPIGAGATMLTLRRRPAILLADDVPAEVAAARPRLVVEAVDPSVSGGDYPVRRIVGEAVQVEATVFGDGHEQLAAELLWRALGEGEWRRVPMAQLPNDRWRASFTPERLGRHEFAVEGWLDRFGGFRRDHGKKLSAGVAQPVDVAEGLALIDAALARAPGGTLAGLRERLGDGAGVDELLLSDELAAAMRAADDRPHALRSPRQLLDAERIEARFSSWYELFPRSITDDPARHGTFADVIGRLPAIRAMGFDTLYFPPIHPIGTRNRKGPNNSLTAGPGDPGSPYAIGAEAGGHEAIHPELGSVEDFAALVRAAREHGLEIALDFAVQCAPDHPWLAEHAGWFAWRPDGSMKYAENPPKKYQDIVNVDFYGPDAVPGLWTALREVVLLWIRRGVTVFRVDNPHTKPLPFWEWLIGDVRARHPEAIFLAEAFTRPNMMYRLGKIGFSQSYTYFTWRDRKAELVDYITELTTTEPREFYRPHFFVTTPDINPFFLQTSGRPGFRIRAVLAATLSGLFGVYSGFELCEAAPVPGKEEYLDSEKYEIRLRDWQAPGNIIADIMLLNRLRREHPALQTHLNTRFHQADDDNVIWYAKPDPAGGAAIFVMVNMDPHAAHTTRFEVPLWTFGLGDDDSVSVEDLAAGHRFRWHGKWQTITLSPDQPYRIWRITA